MPLCQLSAERKWRRFFQARELWASIQYDTRNGTYPQLAFLAPDEHPPDYERLGANPKPETLNLEPDEHP